jgi:hypothetical protein
VSDTVTGGAIGQGSKEDMKNKRQRLEEEEEEGGRKMASQTWA